MSKVPFTIDTDDTERSRANNMLATLGITNEIWTKKSGADKSVGLVGIGNLGVPSENPMAIGPTPAGNYQQANPAPSATTTAPAPNLNAMQIPSTAPAPYVQSNTSNPKANPVGTVSAKNPMGL
jgi:hypothetical protein